MENDKLTDFDLDVISALAKFPENNQDAYIYLRGSRKSESCITVFANVAGNQKSLIHTLAASMFEIEGFKDIILSTALTYLKSDKKEAMKFFTSLVRP
jgi:hypothetical protein